MYEPIFKLKIKADAGVEKAKQELRNREQKKICLPLQGISGEQICLTLNNDMTSAVQAVEAVYQKVTKKNKVRDMILLDAFHSATIEGARTTVENVKKAFSEPKSKDDKMVVNTVRGCDYAYQNLIDEKHIRHLWEMIVEGVCENESKAGILYRDGMVFIGNETRIIHVPARPEQLETMMGQLFDFLREDTLDHILKIFIAHFYFVYIHPFCDGNGRTARILTSSYLYHNGYEKMMYLSLSKAINENLSGYYGSIADSEWKYEEQGLLYLDITPFVAYMLETFEKCMVTSILEENELDEFQKRLLSKMKKRGVKAEITRKNAQKVLGIPDQETVAVLRSMVEMGYLVPAVNDGTEVYILK